MRICRRKLLLMMIFLLLPLPSVSVKASEKEIIKDAMEEEIVMEEPFIEGPFIEEPNVEEPIVEQPEDREVLENSESENTVQKMATSNSSNEIAEKITEEGFVLGTDGYYIINGANMVATETIDFYGSDNGIYMRTEDGEELLCSDVARNLNYGNGKLYYTTEENDCSYIKVANIEEGVIEKSFELTNCKIKHMYLMNQNKLLYSAGGKLYQLDLETEETTTYREYTNIFSFIPTQYGVLYATGSLFDYSLYAEETLLEEHVSDYYTEKENLCFTKECEQYQVAIQQLFDADYKENNLEETMVGGNGMEEVSLEEFLEELGNTNPPENEVQTEAFEQGQPRILSTHAEKSVKLQINRNDANAFISQTNTTAGSLTKAKVNNQQKACQDRAYNIYNTTWTTLKDMQKFGKTYGVIPAGTLIHGIVYGQPVSNGKYVFYGMSFEDYLKETKNQNSLLYSTAAEDMAYYTKKGITKYSPKYSTDCSAFAGYCWGLETKQTTDSIPDVSVMKCKYGNNYVFKGMQTGDVLNSSSRGGIGHVIVITDIQYDANGNIGLIETIEQTCDCTTKKIYKSLADMKVDDNNKDKGLKNINQYILYRSKNIPDNAKLTLSKTSMSLTVGDSETLSATATPGGRLTWTSSDTAVATVSTDGKVTAKKAGSCKIVVKLSSDGADPLSKVCTLTVKKKTLSIDKTALSVYKGYTGSIKATPTPATTVTWKSSNASIATVNYNGMVTGIKVGTATITATAYGISKTCNVAVKAPTFSINKSAISVFKGYAESIKTTPAPSTTVAWKSSNDLVAKVNSSGTVTGIRVGKATITATAHGISRTCKVTVKAPTFAINKTALSIYKGETGSIKATPAPTTAVTWESSDGSVASVNSSGIVTGKKVGKATITATAHGISKKCKVTVNAPTFSINKTTLSIYNGYTGSITAIPIPTTTVAWKSTNTSIATVNNTGTVTGKKVGTATITATAHGISKTCKVTVNAPTLTVAKTEVTVKIRKTVAISAKATPTATITYTSAASGIATVNSSGVVTGKKVGTTWISVTANGITKKVKVLVK